MPFKDKDKLKEWRRKYYYNVVALSEKNKIRKARTSFRLKLLFRVNTAIDKWAGTQQVPLLIKLKEELEKIPASQYPYKNLTIESAHEHNLMLSAFIKRIREMNPDFTKISDFDLIFDRAYYSTKHSRLKYAPRKNRALDRLGYDEDRSPIYINL